MWKRHTPLFIWFTPENRDCLIVEFSPDVSSALLEVARVVQRRSHKVEAVLASAFDAAVA